MTKPISGGPPDFKNWLLGLSELDSDLDTPRNRQDTGRDISPILLRQIACEIGITVDELLQHR